MEKPWIQILLDNINGEVISTIIIGLAGGVVSLKFEQDKITLIRAVILLIAGIAGSLYIGSAICEWLDLSSKVCDGVKFIVALSSMRIFEGILNLAEMFKDRPLWFIDKVRKVIANGNGDNENIEK